MKKRREEGGEGRGEKREGRIGVDHLLQASLVFCYHYIDIDGELEIMITDHQRTKLAGSLVRASSGNVMLHTNMGNLRQPGGRSSVLTQPNNSSYDYNNPTNAIQDQRSTYPTSVMGNVVKHNQNNDKALEKPTSLCRVVSTRTDPEQLKILGNEDYKNGRFEDALALYDAAISIEPNKASYRSNKSAALAALGRLLQAVFECREAIRIEPFYQRAHNRLATLYLRAEALLRLNKHQDADETMKKGPKFEVDEFDNAVASAQLAARLDSNNKEAKRLVKLTIAVARSKIKDWETCLEDCEILLKENPDAEEVAKLQKEARAHLGGRKTSQEMIIEEDFNNDVVVVFNYETFRDYVTSRGIFVVLFSDESSDRSVDREDCPDVAKSEAPYSLPSFKIYKDGSTVKEIAGHKLDYLESLIKFFLS
ncbi:hypothetical protein Leryth_022168 [Lithospermum erythrorhizon]|nr:hypothetical protein Leryth_022168 [Lithospermum erythrorhizon]